MRKNFGTKSWFYPLPVLIIATFNEDGTADAMNAAWGGLYDADKVVLCLSAGHKTTENNQLPRCKHSSTVLGSYVAAHSTCLSLLPLQERKRGMKICLSLLLHIIE